MTTTRNDLKNIMDILSKIDENVSIQDFLTLDENEKKSVTYKDILPDYRIHINKDKFISKVEKDLNTIIYDSFADYEKIRFIKNGSLYDDIRTYRGNTQKTIDMLSTYLGVIITDIYENISQLDIDIITNGVAVKAIRAYNDGEISNIESISQRVFRTKDLAIRYIENEIAAIKLDAENDNNYSRLETKYHDNANIQTTISIEYKSTYNIFTYSIEKSMYSKDIFQ